MDQERVFKHTVRVASCCSSARILAIMPSVLGRRWWRPACGAGLGCGAQSWEALTANMGVVRVEKAERVPDLDASGADEMPPTKCGK